jgi:hypothetical protein
MKALLFTMLLSVMQAAPPVPRQAPNSASGTGQGVTKNTSDNKAPTSPLPSVVNPVAANPDQNASNSPKAKNAPQSISIRDLPSVSVSRDWADWVLWVFNGLLVAAGFFGIRVAYKTLGIIERQTKATEDAAKATEKSVRLQEAQLRQWVDIEGLGCRTEPTFFTGIAETMLIFRFEIFNRTNMPLTLEWVISRVCGGKQSSPLHYTLAPTKSYHCEAATSLKGDSLVDFGTAKLVRVVIITVGFVDAFDNSRKQVIAYTCLCGPPNLCKTSPYEGEVPDDSLQKQPYKAN